MNNRNRKNGFILLLVIAMIPLVGMVVAILNTNSKTLTFRIRRELLQTKAEDAALSGLAWARRNPEEVQKLSPETPLFLSVEEGPGQVYSRLERIHNTGGEDILQISGHAEEGAFSADVKHRLILSAP